MIVCIEFSIQLLLAVAWYNDAFIVVTFDVCFFFSIHLIWLCVCFSRSIFSDKTRSIHEICIFIYWPILWWWWRFWFFFWGGIFRNLCSILISRFRKLRENYEIHNFSQITACATPNRLKNTFHTLTKYNSNQTALFCVYAPTNVPFVCLMCCNIYISIYNPCSLHTPFIIQ